MYKTTRVPVKLEQSETPRYFKTSSTTKQPSVFNNTVAPKNIQNGGNSAKLESNEKVRSENNTTNVQKERKLAPIHKQLGILMWKNYVLSKRNVCGLLTEIICPVFVLLVLLLIRYFVDVYVYSESTSKEYNAVDLLPSINTSYVLYYPNNAFILSIVTNAMALIKMRRPTFNPIIQAASVSNGSSLDSNTLANLTAFISFPSSYSSSFPDNVTYNIYTQETKNNQYRVDLTKVNSSDYMFYRSPNFYCFDTKYFVLYAKFNAIKAVIDLKIIESMTGKVMNDSTVIKVAMYPCQAFNRDEIIARFSFFTPILVVIAFLFTLLVNIGDIIVEKESKMKEYLRLIGVKWYAIWFSWLIRAIIIYTIISVILAGISVIELPARQANNSNFSYASRKLFVTTDFTVIFSTLFVYSIQVTFFTLMISQFFSKPFIAKVIVILFWIATAINFYDSLPYSALKYIFCIFPNCGLTFAFQMMFQYERSARSLTYVQLYGNIFGDTLNLGSVLASMLVSTLLYIPITWYVERILPGDYGVPLPFYFPFMPSYWKHPERIRPTNSVMKVDVQPYGFENEPPNLKANVAIQEITKEFRTGLQKKKVVNNMSLNFYENQITGLLGHNGAGKTTTTFMLCGIYPPTSGTASILGYDIVTEMDKIRTSMGFCPQHDILYEDLNVEEHLELVAMVKGFPKSEIKNEVLRISTYVGLQNDLKTRSKGLSGGMKRRLSVAMALIGDSKVIILDEPTSGLDPYNRRLLWELVRNYKTGRTIILTTHFMEEADALSDRIAIMNHGEVKCCGSPLFLKNLFGSGYKLTISKFPNFKESEFIDLLSKQISNYNIETNIAAEISIALPYDQSNKMAGLLDQIEKRKEELGVSSYGISSSTIEEVFLKVGQIDTKDETNDDEKQLLNNEKDLTNAFRSEFSQNHGGKLWFQQVWSLFVKRFLIFTRRYILALTTLLLPFIMEAIIAGVVPSGTNVINSLKGLSSVLTPYKLDIQKYNPQTIPYYVSGTTSTSSLESLISTYFSSSKRPGITMEKISNSSLGPYVLQKRKDDVQNLVNNYYVGLNMFLNSSYLYMTGYYSTIAYHSSASIINEISNFMLAYLNSNSLSKTITTYNSPISANDSRSNSTDFLENLACLDVLPLSLFNFLNSVVVAFIISVFVVHIGRERLNGSKTLQLLSGTHYVTYWVANYIFDLIICWFIVGSLVGVLKLVDYLRNDSSVETYVFAQDANIGYFALLFILSSLSWPLIAYLWTFLFQSEIIGFVVLTLILGLSGFVEMILSFLQLFIQNDTTNPSLNNAIFTFLEVLRWILTSVSPAVTIKRAMFDMKTRENSFCIWAINNVLKTSYTEGQSMLSFTEPGIAILLLICVGQALIGIVLLLIIEQGTCGCCSKKQSTNIESEAASISRMEEDVKNEFFRIKKANHKELSKMEPLIVNDLYKTFKKKKKIFVAVDHQGFGVEGKQCFGLLGINGAGKTTTFKVLTGELSATSGNAYINGHDISKSKFNARRNLGFCPQFDYLPEYMTVKQALTLFANLRGIKRNEIKGVVADLMKVFKLDEFTDKLVQNLSGGNKRKVSSAIAFLGRPSVVILDEPTTGMDPAAKRYLWTVISKARDMGMTIVLTSHSMEECEALCTKLGIMVNGQFQCLGNIQHLKNKFGKGYSLVIKAKHSDKYDQLVNSIKQFVSKNIKASVLKEQQQETFYYHIDFDKNNPDTRQQSLSTLFSLIEKNKTSLSIETYSVSQTTLEDVFLSFARLQRKEDEDDKSSVQVIKNDDNDKFSKLTDRSISQITTYSAVKKRPN